MVREMKTLEEFIDEQLKHDILPPELARMFDSNALHKEYKRQLMGLAAEILRVCEEWCKFERRETEFTPAGHPISCVTERGFERTGNDLLDFLKSYINSANTEGGDAS